MSKNCSHTSIPEPLFNIGAPLPTKKLTYSLLYEELMAEFITINSEFVRGKFEGPNGIRTKLELKLNLRTREFKEQKFEELKLLKLIYTYQESAKQQDNGSINLINIMAKPTIENVDPQSLGHTTLYGDYFQNIKRDLEEEIDPVFIKLAKESISTLCLDFHNAINEVTYYMLASNGDIDRLDSINKVIKSYNLPDKSGSSYKHTLLETFYLKLLEHENIAREKDLLSMKALLLSEEELSNDYIKEMKQAVTWSITTDGIVDFIKEQIFYISQLVLMKQDVSQKEMQKIISYAPHASRLLNWYSLHSSSNFSNGVPLWTIVSCFQVISAIYDKKTTYAYRPYGYLTERTTLSSKLKMGDECPVFFQILLVRLAKRKGLLNLGYKNQVILLDSIEKTFDQLLVQALAYHNIEDLVALNIHNLFKLD